MNQAAPDISPDFFYNKKVVVLQNRVGYRFSVDAPILAHFLPASPDHQALEIGTGCGIVSLLALFKNKFSRITGLEIQKKLSRLATINAGKNHLQDKFSVIQADFNRVYKNYFGIDWIFSNPPFQKKSQGPVSPNREISIARAEIRIDLEQILEKSFAILDKNGGVSLIFPAGRKDELEATAKKIGFHIAKIQMVSSFTDSIPERFLIQLSKKMLPEKQIRPLVIFKRNAVYTRQMKKILSG